MVGKTALMVCAAVGLSLPAAAEELIRFAPKCLPTGRNTSKCRACFLETELGSWRNEQLSCSELTGFRA
jgi:hypothetical protein